jgi:hypothetical protein
LVGRLCLTRTGAAVIVVQPMLSVPIKPEGEQLRTDPKNVN